MHMQSFAIDFLQMNPNEIANAYVSIYLCEEINRKVGKHLYCPENNSLRNFSLNFWSSIDFVD